MAVCIGDKIGRLTIKERAKRQYYFICECECGNLKEVRSDHLKNERIRSCGCLQKETSKRLGHERAKSIAGHNRIDITGKRFGRLVAKEMVRHEKYGVEIWRCKCDCGSVHEVYKSNLLSGHTTSCGCSMSKMEEKVARILTEEGIGFVKNKTFDGCRSESGALAKFDFYVNGALVVECDGEHHRKYTGGVFTDEMIDKIQKMDDVKDKWCADNDIPIIRIPYSHYKKIRIYDLLPGTSPFLMETKGEQK